jgi:glutamine cyclotransferase
MAIFLVNIVSRVCMWRFTSITDFSKLWPQNVRRKAHADVLNGISISEDPDILYFTGKNWDRMFRIRLLI